jgi:hypothetical protein
MTKRRRDLFPSRFSGTSLGNSKYSRHSRTLKALLEELTQRDTEKTQRTTELRIADCGFSIAD